MHPGAFNGLLAKMAAQGNAAWRGAILIPRLHC
jgi:hypothetical protein